LYVSWEAISSLDNSQEYVCPSNAHPQEVGIICSLYLDSGQNIQFSDEVFDGYIHYFHVIYSTVNYTIIMDFLSSDLGKLLTNGSGELAHSKTALVDLTKIGAQNVT
jgi:hypothetical protein